MNPARQENMPTGKFFFLPSKHWFPSGWTTSMITTGSRRAKKELRFSQIQPAASRISSVLLKTTEISYRLVDSRCCGHPGGSCSPGSGSSSCTRPPPGWCRCRTSDRSRSGRATPTPIEPEPQFLEDNRTKLNHNCLDFHCQTRRN